VLVTMMVAACSTQAPPPTRQSGPPPTGASPTVTEPQAANHASAGAPAPPGRIRIGRIQVDQPIGSITIRELAGLPGTLSLHEVAWLEGTSMPGQLGTMAMLGHSTFKNAGAFRRLGLLRPGDTVSVGDADHRTHSYQVVAVREFPKSSFPTEVWSPQPVASLVLITCSGDRDRTTGYHRNNLLVWAVEQG
jgi:LPXTG-site transpeptidase (sortase) family protein